MTQSCTLLTSVYQSSLPFRFPGQHGESAVCSTFNFPRKNKQTKKLLAVHWPSKLLFFCLQLWNSPWGDFWRGGESDCKQAMRKHRRPVASFAWGLLECTPLWGKGERVCTLQHTAPTQSNKSCNLWYCKTNMGADLIKTRQNPFIWAHLWSHTAHSPMLLLWQTLKWLRAIDG